MATIFVATSMRGNVEIINNYTNATIKSSLYFNQSSPGFFSFENIPNQTYTVRAYEMNGQQQITVEESKTINITSANQKEFVILPLHQVYGIKRKLKNNPYSFYERTDDAEIFDDQHQYSQPCYTITKGDDLGSSPFDALYPWVAMERVTLDTGDVMVKIPTFWYKRYRDSDYEYMKIASYAADGFTLFPCFSLVASQKPNSVYVGAYQSSNSYKSSVSGAISTCNSPCKTACANAASKGVGWAEINLQVLCAIQFLMMIEYAVLDIGSLFRNGNYCDIDTVSDSADQKVARTTGKTDILDSLTGCVNGTGDIDDHMIYRGIEDFIGSLACWLSGVMAQNSSGKYYIATSFANMRTTPAIANGVALSYYAPYWNGDPSGNGVVSTYEFGYDKNYPWCLLPSNLINTTSKQSDGRNEFPASTRFAPTRGSDCPVYYANDARKYETKLNFKYYAADYTINEGKYQIGGRLIYITND